MYLKDTKSGDLVEVLDMTAVTDPSSGQIAGRFHSGEEMQPETSFAKGSLVFPSGENLPSCWTNPDYRH
jgi:hypothetical protein